MKTIPSSRLFTIFFFSLVGLLACHSTLRSAAAEQQDLSPNQRWMDAVNGGSWEDVYTEQAIHINADGSVINGREEIIELIKQQDWHINSIATTQTATTHRDSSFQYGLGRFYTQGGQMYQHLLIWNLEGEIPMRELEMIVKADEFDQTILDQINQRRTEWIELCNQHNAKHLVEELYSEDAIYYNHKPIIRGREAITADYQYMNRPQYNLLLTPIIISAVNEQLVYEIGQCSGSYGGKYILVWEKETDGKWYISMDANL
ncbi:MAG: hypothetical protein AB8H47_05570 [Bacteroidia bacterium]